MVTKAEEEEKKKRRDVTSSAAFFLAHAIGARVKYVFFIKRAGSAWAEMRPGRASALMPWPQGTMQGVRIQSLAYATKSQVDACSRYRGAQSQSSSGVTKCVKKA